MLDEKEIKPSMRKLMAEWSARNRSTERITKMLPRIVITGMMHRMRPNQLRPSSSDCEGGLSMVEDDASLVEDVTIFFEDATILDKFSNGITVVI